ncbi:MAG: hypothetical protein IPJ82_08060 [Lewinellaceae bacterium]|nr:hypothetical protein [Lewinellaceae bacterium]
MKNALLPVVFFAIAGFIACSRSKSDSAVCTGSATTFQLDEPFFLCYDATVQGQDDNEPLAIHFYEVSGDSRCASDVDCVWQGRVDIGLSLSKGQAALKDTLYLGGLNDNPTSDSTLFAGYKIKLLRVDPYPTYATDPIPNEEYKIKLVVSSQ